MIELLNRLALVFFGVAVLAVAFFFFNNGGDALGNTSSQEKQFASIIKRISELESQVEVLKEENQTLKQIETRLNKYTDSQYELQNTFTKKNEELTSELRHAEQKNEKNMAALHGKLTDIQNSVKKLAKHNKVDNR